MNSQKERKKERKKERILLTGGAGFIGSSLADKLLEKNCKIVVIDNFDDFYPPEIKRNNIAHNLNNPDYKLYEGDICCKNLLDRIFEENNIETVIHLAAKAGVRPSLLQPAEYVRTNIEGTVNILETMKKYSVNKMIFASSSSVYGNSAAEKFREDAEVNKQISPYAASKKACEEFCYTYSKLYNIRVIVLRFFTVYGPRQRPDLAIRKFIELINKNEPVPVYGDGSALRDYTFIDDILTGIINAMHYDKTQYEIINLGGGTPVTLNEMISSIEKILGKNAKINRLPMQDGDVYRTAGDIHKARLLLGYNPQTTFEQGLKKFTDWMKKENLIK